MPSKPRLILRWTTSWKLIKCWVRMRRYSELKRVRNEQPDLTRRCVSQVALVYLLYEQSRIALQYIMQILRHANFDVLTEWAKFQKKDGGANHWKPKLVEALCIIQNYKLLKNLGMYDVQLITHFLCFLRFQFLEKSLLTGISNVISRFFQIKLRACLWCTIFHA